MQGEGVGAVQHLARQRESRLIGVEGARDEQIVRQVYRLAVRQQQRPVRRLHGGENLGEIVFYPRQIHLIQTEQKGAVGVLRPGGAQQKLQERGGDVAARASPGQQVDIAEQG